MRSHGSATDVLRAEHRLILRVVEAFERIINGDIQGRLPLDDLDACITFFRLFTDACHHGKEEDLLFTTLEEHGLPGADGPIAALRAEHIEGRLIVRTMADALARVRAGDNAAVRALLDAGADYVVFIRDHIRREDDGVFELADRMVEGPACRALCDRYDAVCTQHFDGRSLHDLERLAAELIERYPGRDARTRH